MGEKSLNEYEIFPVPQNITYYKKCLNLPNKVTIVKKCNLNISVLPKLESALREKNISFNISNVEEDGLNIILSEKTMDKIEGYTLKIDKNIEIIGNDKDGVFYGIVTLANILKQVENTLLKCEIIDYPEIIYRGYIEGFYGYPWSHKNRINLMAFGGEQKLNTYIYAPKDDPFHRKDWREFYPDEKAKEIRELAEAGHLNNINFVWTIHPGDSIDLTLEEDFKSTIKKLEQLYSLGVRQFGILFDDIGGIPNGKQQADYINRVDSEFIKPKKDIKPLITVGTRYCEAWGPSMEGYFKDFVETLHKDVEIMWTGAATMSNISYEQLDAPKRKIGTNKNLSIWWNYPVNDYCDSKILMGKIENLSSDVTNANGFFANPMNQAQASKQALFCIADHNWNTHSFNPDKSFCASFKAIAPEVSEELKIFASNCSYVKEDGGISGTFLFDESWYLKDDIKKLEEAFKNKKSLSPYVDNLLNEFIKIENAVDKINKDCKNKDLVEELAPFLSSLKYLGVACKNSMLALKSLQEHNIDKMEEHNLIASENLQKTYECKVNRLKDGQPRDFIVDVGTLILKPFVKEVISHSSVLGGIESAPLKLNYNMKNIALKSLGVTATTSSGKDEEEQVDNLIKGKIAGGKWCSLQYRPYAILDFKEVKNFKQYKIVNCGHPEAGETHFWNTKHAQILASKDGENYTVVDEFKNNTEHIVNRLFFDEVEARYIKLQILEPAQISINGGGHTRIYSFELFDEAYPYQSDKILPPNVKILNKNSIYIKDIKKGDTIKIYKSLNDESPILTTEEMVEDKENLIIENINLDNLNRIFIERISRKYLPSVRTSKSLK